MSEISVVAIFLAALLTNNILLTNYLGMCSFLAVSSEVKASAGLGMAVTFVMAVTSLLNWLIEYYLLVPLDLVYLRYLVYIIVVAAFVQLVEMIIERVSESLYAALGIFLPLITVNCAILGASLFIAIREYTLAQALAYGTGGGLGWALAIVALAGIRQKMARARVPRGLSGAGISLIITGIMALAFIGFSGMIKVS